MKKTAFVDAWRRAKSRAFDLESNSTARRTVEVDFWGRRLPVYANANLSIYSAQTCNARCPFCVEELRPASRGTSLDRQKTIESDDERYFEALRACLEQVSTLAPSLSVTGGEPSKDPRLPRILRLLEEVGGGKRTVTTNGSGLLDVHNGRPLVDWIGRTGVAHLNISRAHPDTERNARLMRFSQGLDVPSLRRVVERAREYGTRVRLSCVLLRGDIESLDGVLDYLELARSIGVDNVIFRQLMMTDPRTVEVNYVVRYCDRRRARLEPILDAVSRHQRFAFVRQVVGYYYYVEVWRHRGMDVVFEEADLRQLEKLKRQDARSGRHVVHELVFHPNARLASTWQPWDGVLGPPVEADGPTCGSAVRRPPTLPP